MNAICWEIKINSIHCGGAPNTGPRIQSTVTAIIMISWYGNAFCIKHIVRGIHPTLVDSLHTWPVISSFDASFIVNLSLWKKNQSRIWGKEMPCQCCQLDEPYSFPGDHLQNAAMFQCYYYYYYYYCYYYCYYYWCDVTVIAKYIDGLVQDCRNSTASALELLQSCTKPLIYPIKFEYSFVVFCVDVVMISRWIHAVWYINHI